MSAQASGIRKTIFRPTLPEFRRAVCLFAKGAEGKIWESDLALLLELAFGQEHRRERGWTCFLTGSETDDGMVPLDAVLSWIDCGELTDVVGRGHGCAVNTRGSFTSFCDLVATFNQFDCDSNGVICAKDLRFALTNLTGKEPSIQDCKKMIKRVDSNDDGVVDLCEFVEMMRCPKLTRQPLRH